MFGNFISDCVRRRNEHPKATLQNLFWKELSNSTYGKTAQGLRKKRVYDLQAQGTKQLDPSRITNAFFAAFITSFVRAVLGEIMNGLPAETCVFSCTTDGFLTNATDADITLASQGVLASLYREGREGLVGSPQLLETKHECRQPLGWRTRGQATLVEGDTSKGDDYNIVLAKGGIYTASHLDNVRLMNEYIVNRFLERTPDDIIDLTVMTGVRDIMEFDADLVSKQLTRRLNMEFDWKRRPYAVGTAPVGHVAFSTLPWESVAEFQAVRGYWEELRNSDPFCIKSLDDYNRFARHVLSKTSLDADARRYLKRSDPDIKRLRQCLGSAWRNSKAGLVWQQGGISNSAFAEILSLAGVPARRSDVENDGKKPFKPHRCPPTPPVKAALAHFRKSFPALDVDSLLSISDEMIDLTGASSQSCAMIARL
ncbi:hypothetical protein [Caulobacter sp. RL271]|uniref:DNA-directed DNA polymerase n=1 Tax=Caulobacter segnis TaxID=88688 RepID=A0ABY4ZT41_9CAUL|nr:hypothetical protein [Caulobacter segnis]USQ95883.1 hypothetical protein MZV50_25665 [Caulobacter segnis]